MLFLLFSFAVALDRPQSSETHALHPHNAPRLVESITRAKPVPANVAYASSVPKTLPATQATTKVVTMYGISQETDQLGNCYPAFYYDPEHSVAKPKLPLYAHWNQPIQIVPNNTKITMSCDSSYALVGNSQILCLNGEWIGTLGQCVCARDISWGWCGLTASQNVYHFDDCDGDNIPDHICENYDTTNEQLVRTIMASKGKCLSTSAITIKDCPSIFKIFPVAVFGQCYGLNYNSASTFNDCSRTCAQDPNCNVWQWSNIAKQCWMGNPTECDGPDKQWFGGARECVRPQTWCAYPALGDLYVHQDCDGDEVIDHVCLNGNSGGRIASGSKCKNNWPLAIDTDCPTVFGNY